MYVSILTLKYFEDMGVYIPNYDMGRDLIFGKNEGCSFM